MARSSDIEFAKLSFIFGFATKEQVIASIKEAALLHELGVNRRLTHIMYEREYLRKSELQALLWLLVKSRRIDRIPHHVTYEFSEADDQNFLESLTFTKGILYKPHSTEESELDISEKESFPQEKLIDCIRIQDKIKEKGFQRTILSILMTTGNLTKSYYHLVPHLSEKKVSICSSELWEEEEFSRKCEYILCSALAKKHCSLKEKDAQKTYKIWESLVRQSEEIPLRYGELLCYLSFISDKGLNEVSILFEEITKLSLTSYYIPETSKKDYQFLEEFISDENSSKIYRDSQKNAELFEKQGFSKLNRTKLFLHSLVRELEKGTSNSKLLLSKQNQLLDYMKEYRYPESSTTIERKRLFKALVPFSVFDLEKDFEKQYVQERQKLRRRPTNELDEFLQKWIDSQGQSVQEIETFTNEDIPLRGGKKLARQAHRNARTLKRDVSLRTPKILDQTEYISLDAVFSDNLDKKKSSKTEEKKKTGSSEKKNKKNKKNIAEPVVANLSKEEIFHVANPKTFPSFAPTEYIAIDDKPSDIQELIQKIRGHEFRSISTLFWATFVVAVGLALTVPSFQTMGENPENATMLVGLNVLMIFFPSVLLGNYLGKIADQGSVHYLFLLGFCSNFICLPFLVISLDIYIVLLLRFIQGLGLSAIWIGGKFCTSRWFGPGERGRMMGTLLMFFTASLTLGFFLPTIISPSSSTILTLSESSLLLYATVWSFIGLTATFFVYRLRVKPIPFEGQESTDKAPRKLPFRPLFAAILYGAVLTGFLVVYFPNFIRLEVFQNNKETFFPLPLGIILGSYFFGRLSDWVGPIPVLRALSGLAIVALLLAPMVLVGLVAQVAFFVIGCLLGSLIPLGFTWFLEEIENERYFGVASGEYSRYHSLGAILGTFFCAFIFQEFGSHGLFLVLTLIATASFYLALVTPTKDISITNEPKTLGGLLRILEYTNK